MRIMAIYWRVTVIGRVQNHPPLQEATSNQVPEARDNNNRPATLSPSPQAAYSAPCQNQQPDHQINSPSPADTSLITRSPSARPPAASLLPLKQKLRMRRKQFHYQRPTPGGCQRLTLDSSLSQSICDNPVTTCDKSSGNCCNPVTFFDGWLTICGNRPAICNNPRPRRASPVAGPGRGLKCPDHCGRGRCPCVKTITAKLPFVETSCIHRERRPPPERGRTMRDSREQTSPFGW
jgi:hypothetical protein